jgi:CRP-like cAMP-binding protein
MELIDAIGNSFGLGLKEAQTALLASIARTREFDGGEVLIRQFDRNSDLILLLEGRAKIYGFSDKELKEVGAGSVFGEMSLVDDQPRSASVRGAGKGKAAIFSSKDLRDLLMSNPDIAARIYENIARVLCSRLRVATIELDGLMGK